MQIGEILAFLAQTHGIAPKKIRHISTKSGIGMIEEVMETLLGEKPENDIFRISYSYAERDFEGLLEYRKERYNPDVLLTHLRKERKKLQNLKRLQSLLSASDRTFHTKVEEKLVFREFIRAEDKLHRFALIRDLGADAHLMKQRSKSRRWGEKMLIKYKDEYPLYFESQDEFIRVIRNFSPIDDEEPFLWLHAYIREFIKICPKSYLEKGTFGKFMRSVFGVLYYTLYVENVDYHDTPRLSGYFAATYLFDDILDDPGYSIEEKKQYYQNVVSILQSRTQDEITFSNDPVMAFSEYALVGMREILDETRARLISQSYLAIGRANTAGKIPGRQLEDGRAAQHSMRGACISAGLSHGPIRSGDRASSITSISIQALPWMMMLSRQRSTPTS